MFLVFLYGMDGLGYFSGQSKTITCQLSTLVKSSVVHIHVESVLLKSDTLTCYEVDVLLNHCPKVDK